MLRWYPPLSVAIIPSTAFGHAEVEPVGCAIAVTTETIGLNKGLASKQWHARYLWPVDRQLLEGARENP